MENILLKYSDLIKDDGAFDKIRSDLDSLEQDLKAKARRLKGVLDVSDLFDAEKIKDFEQETEGLKKAFDKIGDSRKSLDKIEEEYRKQVKKTIDTQEDQIDALIELDKELKKQQSELKRVNAFQKQGIKTSEDLNKSRVEAEVQIKRLRREINRQQKEIIESNELSKEQQKLIKAKITLDKNQVRSLNEVRERIAALRVVVQSLDFEDQADQVKAYNDEINELTEVLSANSDKFIQSKINIGNYEESIVNALNSTSLFTTGIGVLDSSIGALIKVLTITGDELDTLEQSLKQNSNALKRFTVAFGRLNKVLKASIIGTVLIALTGLVSLFGDTRAGAIRLEKVTKTLGTAFTTLGQIVRIVFSNIADSFQGVRKNFDAVTGIVKGLATGNLLKAGNAFKQFRKNSVESVGKTREAWKELVDAFENGFDAIVEGLENIENSFRIQDEIRGLERDLAKLEGRFSLLQRTADDSTKSFATQLRANRIALGVAEEIANRELKIAKLRLDEVNERLKQNVKANQQEVANLNLALKGVPLAEATLALAKQRGAQLEISNGLLEEQQQAVIAIQQAENNRNLVFEENAQKRREIERDLFEQNLDLLIDLIDTQKNLSEQQVNDTAKNFEARVEEFNRFVVKFRENAQRELNEFNKLAERNADILRQRIEKGLIPRSQLAEARKELEKLQAIEFNIEFNDDGSFDVFNNGVKLSLQDIVQLNKELQELGLSEIPINRFREFNIETTNAVRDFKDLNKELTLVSVKVNELFGNLAVDEAELDELDRVNSRIRDLAAIDPRSISQSDRKKIIKELEQLEKERTEIENRFARKRRDNRIDAINEELKTVESGSERELELLRERAALEKSIRDQIFEDNEKSTRASNEKIIKEYERFVKEVRRQIGLVLSEAVRISKERVEKSKDSLKDQEEAEQEQRRRAELGLQNTLAFEQRELAKRELDLVRRQKKQERLEKIQALYTSYNNYADRGVDNPIQRALKDFAILEVIAATFEHGGIVGLDGYDNVRTNSKGITQGRSHNMKNGVLAYHQGGEGFWSRQDVAAVGGAEGFYKIREAATSGMLDSNFFSGQSKKFIQSIPVPQMNDDMIGELRQIHKAIKKQPVPSVKMGEVTQHIMEVIEEQKSGNKVKRNTYLVRKPRP